MRNGDISWAEVGLMLGNALGQGWMNHLYDSHKEGAEAVPEKEPPTPIQGVISSNGDTAEGDASIAQTIMKPNVSAKIINPNPKIETTNDTNSGFTGKLLDLAEKNRRDNINYRQAAANSLLANALPNIRNYF